MKYDKIDSLTSFRFIAAAMIVVHHSRGVLWLTMDNFSHFALDQAVSFFFVLSGFVLAYVYPTLGDGASIKRFYISRFARIWPNHVAAFIAIFVLFLPWTFYAFKEDHTALIAIFNLLLVHGWIPMRKAFFSFNGVMWAVSAELFFYLTFPVFIKNFEKTWLNKLAFSMLTIIGLVILCNRLHLPYDETVAPDVISRTGIIYINPLCRLFEFILGMSVALLWRQYHQRINMGKTAGTLAEVLVVCMAITTIYYSVYAAGLIGLVGPAGAEYIFHAASCFSFGILIFIMALQSGLISRVMRYRIPVLLGEASYAIFVVHQIILRFYSYKKHLFTPIPEPFLYALFWTFLLLVSFAVMRFIENPSRRFITNLFLSSKKQAL